MKIYNRNETINAINDELKKRNISNTELAVILQVSASAVCRKLNGSRDFTLQELITLSNLFDMDLMKLIKFIEKAGEK